MKCKYNAIEDNGKWYIRKTRYENLCIFDEYFTGYSFMGDSEWTDSVLSNRIRMMDREEAKQVIKDLEAAEDDLDEDPDVEKLEAAIRSENATIKDFIGALYFIKGWNPYITIKAALDLANRLANERVISFT